jgi:hypothetical protein
MSCQRARRTGRAPTSRPRPSGAARSRRSEGRPAAGRRARGRRGRVPWAVWTRRGAPWRPAGRDENENERKAQRPGVERGQRGSERPTRVRFRCEALASGRTCSPPARGTTAAQAGACSASAAGQAPHCFPSPSQLTLTRPCRPPPARTATAARPVATPHARAPVPAPFKLPAAAHLRQLLLVHGQAVRDQLAARAAQLAARAAAAIAARARARLRARGRDHDELLEDVAVAHGLDHVVLLLPLGRRVLVLVLWGRS